MDWKNSRHIGITVLALVLSLCAEAQNLVPNPSFEEYTECPYTAGRIWHAPPWLSVRGSCDYFHECGTNGYGVPMNIGGGGYARTGQAYGQFIAWTVSPIYSSELIGTELTDSLIAGTHYRVEFHVSMMDSVWYASRNLGAYFSTAQPVNEIDTLQNYEPQIRYEGDFITDKEGWTRVSGSFVAQGGERFMTIGNFDSHEETETLFVPDGGIPPSHSATFWEAAGYFIDDVSVIPDSITSVQEVADMERSHKLYPNPNTGEFTLSLTMDELDIATMTVWNISGQQVHAQQLTSEFNTVKLDVADGLYLYSITLNGTPKWTGKVSISSH